MKKTAFSLSIIFLAALFFASCSNLENLSIEKRHYAKGYYVHANGKRDVKTDVKSEEIVALTEKQNNVPATEAIAAKNEIAKTEIAPVASEKPAVKSNTTKAKNVTVNPVVAVEKNTQTQSQPTLQPKSKKKMNHSDGDVSAVLLVILCILLPPLAVFLVDGIGLNFWLDLILTLLFFLPGIIFALIVCFA